VSKKALISVLFAVIILAAALFTITRITSPEGVKPKPEATDGVSEEDYSRFFSSPEASNAPSMSEASGASSTRYEPVHPVNIGSEGVYSPVTLHHFVPENLRFTYFEILNRLKNYEKDIVLSRAVSEDDFLHILIYIRDFNPELFFIDWSLYNYKATSDSKITEVNFTFFEGDTGQMAASLESKVKSVVEQANRYPNLFERELFVHDWLINNVTYLVDEKNTGSAYGALVESKARCEGYARAFQLIMLRLGVPTLSVIGTAENERHMWNAVDLYGEYYFVDVTFDDDANEKNITSYSEQEISHSCFNITDEVLLRTHIVSPSGSSDKYGAYQNLVLPECNSNQFNYFRIRGLAVKNLNQFKYVLERNASNKRACVLFEGEMPSPEELQSAFRDFFEDVYSYGGYSIYYTPVTSPVFKRNVYEISWTVN